MEEAYIVRAKRTPIGTFGQGLKNFTAIELGSIVAQSLLDDLPHIQEQISEVYIGNVFKAGLQGNPARQIALAAGLSTSSIAQTIDMQCASGLAAIIQGANRIVLREAELVLVGGVESVSNAPHLLLDSRWGKRFGNPTVVDSLMYDHFVCAMENKPLCELATQLAAQYDISEREEQAFTRSSYEKAHRAMEDKRFREEITPLIAKGVVLFHDENLQGALASELVNNEHAEPVIWQQQTSLNDGASLLLLASKQAVDNYKLQPMAKIIASTSYGVKPASMGVSAVPAILHLLDQVNMTLQDMDLIELNEAFAAQVLAVTKELHLDENKLNVNGGSLALGHAVGATGACIVTTLVHELTRQQKTRGLAAVCAAGGIGTALIVERV